MLPGTRRIKGALGAALSVTLAAACVNASPATEDGVPVVQWWTVPGHGDFHVVAEACNAEFDGAFEIRVDELPVDPVERRSDLLRRLTVDDPGVDLVSLDTELTPEFASAGLIDAVPDERAQQIRDSAHPEALATVDHEGDLRATPYLWEPQLLWYRPSVAQRAGLDMTEPVSWDDLLEGAERAQSSVVLDDPDGRMVVRWVVAIVSGAGGTVLTGPEDDPAVGLDGAPGEAAVVALTEYLGTTAGSGPHEDSTDRFASTAGGFAIAGPSFIADPAVQAVAGDLAWAPFPEVARHEDPGEHAEDTAENEDAEDNPEDSQQSVRTVPVSGVNLAVTRGARLPEAADLAVECLTAPRMAEVLAVETGHALAYPEVLTDTLEDAYPLSEVVTDSLAQGAPAPVSPLWGALDEAIVDTWLPLEDLDPDAPAHGQRRAEDLVRGEGL